MWENVRGGRGICPPSLPSFIPTMSRQQGLLWSLIPPGACSVTLLKTKGFFLHGRFAGSTPDPGPCPRSPSKSASEWELVPRTPELQLVSPPGSGLALWQDREPAQGDLGSPRICPRAPSLLGREEYLFLPPWPCLDLCDHKSEPPLVLGSTPSQPSTAVWGPVPPPRPPLLSSYPAHESHLLGIWGKPWMPGFHSCTSLINPFILQSG